MRRLFVWAFALVVLGASAADAQVVMSQVYGGGGSSSGSPAYQNDYVELFNAGTAAVNIGGWSLQYGSSTGNFGNSGNVFQFPASTSIPAGAHILVKLGAAGSLGGTFTADFTSGGLSMAAGSGKVALANIGTTVGCGATATPCTLPDSRLVDVVAWGASNNGEGGTTVNNGTGLTSAQGAIRKGTGCQDTDNNNNDFVVATTSTGLVPRNAATPPHTCTVANLAPSITAPANPITTVAQDSAPFTVSVSGADDGGVYVWGSAAGTGVASVSVTGGQGTSTVTYTVALQAGFAGTASFTTSLSDNVSQVSRVVNIQVTPLVANDPPAINAFANPVATVAQDAAPFAVSVGGFDDGGIYNWSATTGTGVATAVVSSGQGTPNATYTVTLQPGFSGTAAFTARLSDNVNAAVTHPVTITVTPAPPPPLDHVVISQVYGGGGNTGAAYQRDFVELYNASTEAFDLGGWTIQYGSATGTGLWQTQPLGGVMQPGEYYLVALATNGTIGSVVPAANISGDLNLSGTNGKVALVSGGDPLEGCALSDPLLVDLVGYGTTANCREGATNAPTPSNSTAVFRKNGGFTDTNVNGSDFVTGTPNPRRTTPIVEIGPYVLSVDPRRNNTTAPRDASVTVTFTETVTTDAGWYGINCAATGAHNDATVAGGGRVWIITPNVNFTPGELCTVTIFKASIHDEDLDDSAPDTDELKANYIYSFSVATGAAPAYGPDVHLTMGNPSDAEADKDGHPNNFLMLKPEFSISYNRDRGTPNWVSWHLAEEWIGSLVRVDTFRPDPGVPSDWYRVTHVDYFGSGFDRGHMTPNADRDPETSMPINQATFLMSNMIPQAPDNNQGPWANMENYLRTLLPANELYIVAGGAGTGGTGSSGFMTTFANGHITVPAQTWKVALVIPKASGDDVSRVTAASRTIAVIMPNVQGIRNVDWQSYIVSVDQVEALTGYDFFENVSDAVENSIEAGINGTNPPGVENQSFSTREDEAKSFTIDSVSPSSNPLTYTIVSGPSHGTLSGSGASQTYTPAPDFNGSDSFTFRVSSGSLASNTATMTITVLEVNDAPAAQNDSVSTNEDASLTFAASTLTANDSAGPADESGQALTVSGVSATADTNGTVSLAGGAITYTPAADYNGPASFTYQVCDAGITVGLANSLCATATVNVSVTAVNDAPTAGADARTMNDNSTLTFPAAELTSNDTAGPANESAQTLTVTSVAATADTHGTVTLAGGQVSYTPDADFNGAASFSYRVCDNGPDSQCANGVVSVTVLDKTAPRITNVTVSTTRLWPANHKMVDVTVGYDAWDASAPAPSCTLSVTSNEPVNGTGDGDTAGPDWEVVDGHHVRLRAERAGNGTGRTYTVVIDCLDPFANASQAAATVFVPVSNR